MTKQEFLAGVGNWDNHRILLWEALERTKHLGMDVLELGCGDGSTPFLKKYCADNNLKLDSFDSNPDWAAKYGATCLPDWTPLEAWFGQRRSVVLVDEAPGEHRKETLKLFMASPEQFRIIVIHDSEPVGWNASDYQVRPLFHNFQFVHDLKSEKPGAWATWLSNDYEF